MLCLVARKKLRDFSDTKPSSESEDDDKVDMTPLKVDLVTETDDSPPQSDSTSAYKATEKHSYDFFMTEDWML